MDRELHLSHSKRIDTPIFLDHYVETFAQNSNQFTFYYLTNKNDPSSPSFVTIRDMTGYIEQPHHFDYHFQTDIDVQQFTHHVLRRMDVTFPELDSIVQEETFSFDEIEVVFSNGPVVTAPIGEVVIYANYPDDNPLTSPSAEGGSEAGHSWHTTRYKAEEPLTIDEVTAHFEKVISQSDITVEVEGTELSKTPIQDWELPHNMAMNDRLTVDIRTPHRLRSYLSPLIKLAGKTASGQKVTTYDGFTELPELDKQDVHEIIADKSGGAKR